MKLILFLLPFLCFAHPFDYDLHLTTIPGKNGRTMVCFHGYKHSYKIIYALQDYGATLVSFNFPDHQGSHRQTPSFGTRDELLPALYAIKQCILEQKLGAIDLYGFSAGGGAVINLLAALNSKENLGLSEKERTEILTAIQNGLIILDTPLKSVEEIIEFRGSSPELERIAKTYRDNGTRPIDSISKLKGLRLDILLHFQDPDEILFNRDDTLFIERLKNANGGKTTVIIANEGGHLAPHESLLRAYRLQRE